jgi:hypothetical protein
MVIRTIILSLGLAIGISSVGPLGQGLLFSVPGSSGAQVAIYSALGMMAVSVVLLATFFRLESLRPVVTLH